MTEKESAMVICNHHQGCGESECDHAQAHELCTNLEECVYPCKGYCVLVIYEVECIEEEFFRAVVKED